MKKLLLYLSCLLIALNPAAQVTVETGHSGQTKDGALIVYGSDNLKYSIPYERISGTPFLKDTWQKAFLFDHRDTALGTYRARFNFATQEVHYLDRRGEEMVAIPGALNAVVFMEQEDSTKIATVFRTNIPEIKKQAACKTCFVQELNQGDVKLLKITRRQLTSNDSLFGTLKKYYFSEEAEYFIFHDGLYDRVRRLNKDALLLYVPGAAAFEKWIREKQLDFRKEEDWLIFIRHYNETRSSPRIPI